MKIIADACANHCGERRMMDEMIQKAALAGVDVIKFQSFKADKLRKDWPDYENAYAYYKKHELSEDDHHWLIQQCKIYGIEFLTTVFDLETVDFLAGLGLDRVKIASSDCNNWPLIDKCLDRFEHVIISTGMHSSTEIRQLAGFLGSRLEKVTVMHCVSLYPTPPDRVNMMRVAWLMQMFPSVGFSDHTLGTDAGKLAISLGVACVEKHFSLDRTFPGNDQAMSATIDEFVELVDWRDKIQMMMFCPENLPDGEARRYIGKWA